MSLEPSDLLESPEAGGLYRGLRVHAPFNGKTLFEQMEHLELDLRRTDPTPDLERGAVVIPFPHCVNPVLLEQSFRRLKDAWSEPLARAVRSGAVKIVLDISAEGIEHKPAQMAQTYPWLEALGAPPGRVVLVTQDRGYARDHASWCEREGLEPLRVLNYDFWIKRFHTQFEVDSQKRFGKRLRNFEARGPSRGKTFVSLNLTARPTKILFLLSLLRDGLWDRGYVSFGGFRRRYNSKVGEQEPLDFVRKDVVAQMRRLPGFDDMIRELRPLLPQLEAKGVVTFELHDGEGNGPGEKTPLLPMRYSYDDSWFSVITETEMRGRVSRITEKPFKSLIGFQPILVLGSPGALAAIRALGYQTFGDVIDERYDEEEDPRRRFDMVYREFLRLCSLSQDELWRMERSLADRLRFNAEWGLLKLAGEYRKGLDMELMAQIFGDLPRP